MKKISRSGFLKLAAAAAMSGVTAGALTACGNSASSSSAAASSAAVYTPGTYTAKATGMGEVTVSMTFTENAITDVTVDTANETIDLARNSAEDFQKALMEAQSAEIDGVSGATYTSGAVREAAASCIQQAMGVVVEAPAEAPAAAEVKSGFPACEENLGGATAAGQGEIAFVADPIADSEIKETVNVDVLVCGQGPAGMAAALPGVIAASTPLLPLGAVPPWALSTTVCTRSSAWNLIPSSGWMMPWSTVRTAVSRLCIRSGSIPVTKRSTGSWINWKFRWKTTS